MSSVGLLGGENPEGEANSSACQGGPFSALTPSMWPSKGMLNFYKSALKCFKNSHTYTVKYKISS